MRYIDMFLKLKTAGELLDLKVFPNAKEITESLGAYYACKTVIPFRLDDPDVYCYIIGDGHTPRTGILFARMSAWNIFSIDPIMRLKDYKTQRLTLLKNYMQDIKLKSPTGKAVIVAVHSHANPTDCINNIEAKQKWFVEIPCCFPPLENHDDDLSRCFEDKSILSQKNKVYIYNLSSKKWRNKWIG